MNDFCDSVVVAVHGGAGTIRRENLTPETEAACRAALRRALEAGFSVWRDGGAALDIVTAAVLVLEDDPHFNAGRGSVFASDGSVEMDAAAMRGSDRAAGAVAGLRSVRNPVLAARAVMERSPFVFLAGPGAEAFATEQGLALEPESYFFTETRRRQLDAQRSRQTVSLSEDNKFGTVGAVARDRDGGVAAATSTGGMTNKLPGRVGDCPVIGAGTWADDGTVAVSATGHGEFFLRAAAAHDIHSRIAYGGASVGEAADQVVNGTLRRMGGDGGVIALDASGRAALTFNCAGMYRGVIHEDGTVATGIYSEELR